MIKNYKLGSIKDQIDERDYKIKSFLGVIVNILPPKLDLRYRLLTVRDQGNEGSCVSFATTGMKEGQEDEKIWLSPRFLTQRIQDNADSGAYPRDAMDTLLKEGVCTEACQPYIAREVNRLPCLEASTEAKTNKIKGYARIYTIEEMKQTLNEGGPFLASFGVTKDWYNPINGIITVHSINPIIGGHAICIVGYDDGKGLLAFRNSWGVGWGDRGYGYLNYYDVKKYLWDAWSSVDVPEAEEEKPKPIPRKDLLEIILDWIMSLFGWKVK